MSWKVRWHGLEIGVARLEVIGLARSARVRSWFSPARLAAELGRGGTRELTTPLDRDAGPDDLHSALGRVRTWARPGAAPAALVVVHAGERFRVHLAAPELEQPAGAAPLLRIEGQARSARSQVEMTVWLSTDRDRVPISATVELDGKTITAELLDYERGR